ncbi:hypothetical protein KI387_023986, partial [Taxus chinensis]
NDNLSHESVPFDKYVTQEEEADQDGCIKLKGNKIPEGLVSLEELFDKHD